MYSGNYSALVHWITGRPRSFKKLSHGSAEKFLNLNLTGGSYKDLDYIHWLLYWSFGRLLNNKRLLTKCNGYRTVAASALTVAFQTLWFLGDLRQWRPKRAMVIKSSKYACARDLLARRKLQREKLLVYMWITRARPLKFCPSMVPWQDRSSHILSMHKTSLIAHPPIYICTSGLNVQF